MKSIIRIGELTVQQSGKQSTHRGARSTWVRPVALALMLCAVPTLQGCVMALAGVGIRYAVNTAPSKETYTFDRSPLVVLSEAQSLIAETARPDASPDIPMDSLRWKNRAERYEFEMSAVKGEQPGQTLATIDAKLLEDWNNHSDSPRDNAREFIATLSSRLGTKAELILSR
ncbi:hypothetical protein LXM60_16610 [Pandoraea sputorum]|uniref:hypothetical protein n=1 Tax=Pandoraea sputorum TaxID=93222 RepID=UPI001E54074F|nr:hypothetical protein [Pandoraea sputorum]MCE4061823.1 hypothetical protein [Pandoraea sputorum]